LLTQYYSGDKIENNEMGGHVTRMREGRGLCGVFEGKPEENRPLGRPRSRWEDNIKMDLQEVGCEGWTGSSWLRIGADGGHL
jgi:hypothetical protein